MLAAIFFESIARPLLFLHLIAGACVTGVSIHLGVRVWGYLRGRVIKVGHEKLYARLLGIFYAISYLLGAVLYPAFRVRVRAEYFDPDVPWATALFEIKEHLANVGLIAAAGIVLLSIAIDRPLAREPRRLLPMYAGLIAVVLAVVFYNVWSGWYLTTLKAV